MGSPVDMATSRATSTSFIHLDNGAVFALTTSIGTTPTQSAENLGLPEPESSTASKLLVVFVATTLVLCPIPSPSSLDLMVVLAQIAALPVQTSRLALVSLWLLPTLHQIAPPTKSLVSSARPSN